MREVQGLAGVDVPESGDDALIEQCGLDRHVVAGLGNVRQRRTCTSRIYRRGDRVEDGKALGAPRRSTASWCVRWRATLERAIERQQNPRYQIGTFPRLQSRRPAVRSRRDAMARSSG